MKKIAFVSFLLLFSIHAQSQWQWASTGEFRIGGQLGLSFSIGTHTQRVGLMAKVFVHYNFVQINLQALGAYNFHALGSKQKGWEVQLRAGVVGAWGRRDTIVSPYLNEVSNQTGRRYALGYAFNIYRDNFATSQVSGTFGLTLRSFRMVMENDFLSFNPQDRYRTGCVGFYYWLKETNTQIGVHHLSWTGDPYGEHAEWVRDSTFPSRFGYIDTYNAPYGRNSVGALGVEIEQILPFYQYAHAAIGIDAEQIRNAMQNKLIHDSPIIPANWGDNDEGKNPHIPMICVDGKCYLHKEEQQIRPAKFYFQLRGNSTLFY
jgi:hypothetical protein